MVVIEDLELSGIAETEGGSDGEKVPGAGEDSVAGGRRVVEFAEGLRVVVVFEVMGVSEGIREIEEDVC